jgi:nucleoside-diphosphate-sugar epimerase
MVDGNASGLDAAGVPQGDGRLATVLVTGGSGFIGSHCIAQLLAAGHRVRTTVRDLRRAADVRAMLAKAGADAHDSLHFAAADLLDDAGWPEAVAGCDYVLHVASPIPAAAVRHENELIVPAREGTLRVLRAASAAGVRRVVLTSSFAAVGYGHEPRRLPFDETSWTRTEGADVSAYVKSKAVAERAAWDFLAAEGGSLELSAINPVGVFGPVLGSDYSASILIVKGLLDGVMPGCPRIYFGVVDVRDVADLHLRAMTHPAARGERFLATAGDCVSIHDIAGMLRRRLGRAGRRVPRFQLPDWMVRLAAWRSPAARQAVPQLGRIRNCSAEKARRILGWNPRPAEEAIIATAESLMRFGLLAS